MNLLTVLICGGRIGTAYFTKQHHAIFVSYIYYSLIFLECGKL